MGRTIFKTLYVKNDKTIKNGLRNNYFFLVLFYAVIVVSPRDHCWLEVNIVLYSYSTACYAVWRTMIVYWILFPVNLSVSVLSLISIIIECVTCPVLPFSRINNTHTACLSQIANFPPNRKTFRRIAPSPIWGWRGAPPSSLGTLVPVRATADSLSFFVA